jgi:hypothetical protein
MICEETCLNRAGAITVYYIDSGYAIHGFVRNPEGTISSFDAPGAVGFTGPASINNEGAITGYYSDFDGTLFGFLRAPDGKLTTFQLSGGGLELIRVPQRFRSISSVRSRER